MKHTPSEQEKREVLDAVFTPLTPTEARSKSKAAKKLTGRILFAVMRAHTWDALKSNGISLRCPPSGPQRFIPVFNTREQAVHWNDSEENVVSIEIL